MATKKLNDDHVYTTDRFPDGFPQVEQPAIALLDWKGALNSIHQSGLSPQQKKKVKEGLLRVNKFAAQYNSYKIAKYTFGKIAKEQTTTKKQKVSMAFYLARAYIHLNEGVVFVDKHDPKDSNAKGIHRTRDPHLGFSGISLDDLFIKGKRTRPSLLSFFVGEQKVLPKGFKTKILNHMKDFDFGNEEQELKQLFHEVGVERKIGDTTLYGMYYDESSHKEDRKVTGYFGEKPWNGIMHKFGTLPLGWGQEQWTMAYQSTFVIFDKDEIYHIVKKIENSIEIRGKQDASSASERGETIGRKVDKQNKSSKGSGTKRKGEQANSDTANDGSGSSKGSTKANTKVGEIRGGKKETKRTIIKRRRIASDSSDEIAGSSDEEADSSDEEAGGKKENMRTRAQQQEYLNESSQETTATLSVIPGPGTLQATSGTQDTSGEGDAINLSKHNKDRDAATGDNSDNGRSGTMSPTAPAGSAVADPTATTTSTSAPTTATTTTSANTTTPNPSENIKSSKGNNKDHKSETSARKKDGDAATGDNSDNGRSGTMSPTTTAGSAVADPTTTTTSTSAPTTATTTTSANTTTPAGSAVADPTTTTTSTSAPTTATTTTSANTTTPAGSAVADPTTTTTSTSAPTTATTTTSANTTTPNPSEGLGTLQATSGTQDTSGEGCLNEDQLALENVSTTTSTPITTTTTTSANTTTTNNITTEGSGIEVTSRNNFTHYHIMSQVPNEIINNILSSIGRDSPSNDVIGSTANSLLDAFVSNLSESQHSFRTNLCYSKCQHHSIISNGLEFASLTAVNNDTRVFAIIVLAGTIEIDFAKNRGRAVKMTHKEKEAIYLRCPHDNPFIGKCGKQHAKCPYHNKTIKISSLKGEEASFIVLEYSPDPLDSFIPSASAYSIFTNNTAMKITDDFGKNHFYRPRDNNAKGECVLISLLDHLKYLDNKDKLPDDIPVKDIVKLYHGEMTQKDPPVKRFIQGLKKYMTQESVFELVSKAVGGETEISDKIRVRRGDEEIPIKDKYVKYIKQRADMLDNIDPNDDNTWCDIFILWCSSLWLQLPIMVVELSGSRNLLEVQLNTKEGELPGTAWSTEAAKCDTREIEPCFMYRHWGDHPLSLVPEKGREKDWVRHYMHLEPLDNVGSLIEWDGSIEASRKLYDRWNNFQDVIMFPVDAQLPSVTSPTTTIDSQHRESQQSQETTLSQFITTAYDTLDNNLVSRDENILSKIGEQKQRALDNLEQIREIDTLGVAEGAQGGQEGQLDANDHHSEDDQDVSLSQERHIDGVESNGNDQESATQQQGGQEDQSVVESSSQEGEPGVRLSFRRSSSITHSPSSHSQTNTKLQVNRKRNREQSNPLNKFLNKLTISTRSCIFEKSGANADPSDTNKNRKKPKTVIETKEDNIPTSVNEWQRKQWDIVHGDSPIENGAENKDIIDDCIDSEHPIIVKLHHALGKEIRDLPLSLIAQMSTYFIRCSLHPDIEWCKYFLLASIQNSMNASNIQHAHIILDDLLKLAKEETVCCFFIVHGICPEQQSRATNEEAIRNDFLNSCLKEFKVVSALIVHLQKSSVATILESESHEYHPGLKYVETIPFLNNIVFQIYKGQADTWYRVHTDTNLGTVFDLANKKEFDKSFGEHSQTFFEVLQKMNQYDYSLRLDKCRPAFEAMEVAHILLKIGEKRKIDATPKNRKALFGRLLQETSNDGLPVFNAKALLNARKRIYKCTALIEGGPFESRRSSRVVTSEVVAQYGKSLSFSIKELFVLLQKVFGPELRQSIGYPIEEIFASCLTIGIIPNQSTGVFQYCLTCTKCKKEIHTKYFLSMEDALLSSISYAKHHFLDKENLSLFEGSKHDASDPIAQCTWIGHEFNQDAAIFGQEMMAASIHAKDVNQLYPVTKMELLLQFIFYQPSSGMIHSIGNPLKSSLMKEFRESEKNLISKLLYQVIRKKLCPTHNLPSEKANHELLSNVIPYVGDLPISDEYSDKIDDSLDEFGPDPDNTKTYISSSDRIEVVNQLLVKYIHQVQRVSFSNFLPIPLDALKEGRFRQEHFLDENDFAMIRDLMSEMKEEDIVKLGLTPLLWNKLRSFPDLSPELNQVQSLPQVAADYAMSCVLGHSNPFLLGGNSNKRSIPTDIIVAQSKIYQRHRNDFTKSGLGEIIGTDPDDSEKIVVEWVVEDMLKETLKSAMKDVFPTELSSHNQWVVITPSMKKRIKHQERIESASIYLKSFHPFQVEVYSGNEADQYDIRALYKYLFKVYRSNQSYSAMLLLERTFCALYLSVTKRHRDRAFVDSGHILKAQTEQDITASSSNQDELGHAASDTEQSNQSESNTPADLRRSERVGEVVPGGGGAAPTLDKDSMIPTVTGASRELSVGVDLEKGNCLRGNTENLLKLLKEHSESTVFYGCLTNISDSFEAIRHDVYIQQCTSFSDLHTKAIRYRGCFNTSKLFKDMSYDSILRLTKILPEFPIMLCLRVQSHPYKLSHVVGILPIKLEGGETESHIVDGSHFQLLGKTFPLTLENLLFCGEVEQMSAFTFWPSRKHIGSKRAAAALHAKFNCAIANFTWN